MYPYTQDVVLMKLDFISRICEHEHFIPLNLPFKKKSESVSVLYMYSTCKFGGFIWLSHTSCTSFTAAEVLYTLNNEYCRAHYLAGILLTEVHKCTANSCRGWVGLLHESLVPLYSNNEYPFPSTLTQLVSTYPSLFLCTPPCFLISLPIMYM